jgi:hypothetical protein
MSIAIPGIEFERNQPFQKSYDCRSPPAMNQLVGVARCGVIRRVTGQRDDVAGKMFLDLAMPGDEL